MITPTQAQKEAAADDLMSIKDAAWRGVTKLRLDNWANPDDHFEFTPLQTGGFGPWVKLWSPTNELIGQENPQKILITMVGDLEKKCWRKYKGTK